VIYGLRELARIGFGIKDDVDSTGGHVRDDDEEVALSPGDGAVGGR
jgi:hypothetical protein